MIGSYIATAQRALQSILPLLMIVLASYSIWYCHTALSPFSRMRRILWLDQKVRTALFETESIQRGYLLTGDASSLSLYFESKLSLRTQVALLAGEMKSDQRERGIARELETLVKLKIDEMDSTIRVGRRQEFQAAIHIVKSKVGFKYSTEICNDLDLIHGIETGRTYSK